MVRKEAFTSVFSHDMAKKEGWVLLEDARRPWPISAGKLDLIPFLREWEDYISGEEIVRRAQETLNANLGQRHAEFLLEHQQEIPEEFRNHYLVFPGTIWRDCGGRRYVAYLYWRGSWWCLSFRWLEYDFDDDDRLLCPRG